MTLARTFQNNLEQDSTQPPKTKEGPLKLEISDNVLEWSAEEFSKFLNDCIKKHRPNWAE